MSHGRKPALSQKTLAFLRAEVIHPFQAQNSQSKVERAAAYLIGGAVLGFMFLAITAPVFLVLALFTPINLTVLWLEIGAGLFAIGFLGMLPQFVQESLWKASLLVLIVTLIGLTLYGYGYTSLPSTLIETPTLIAYGLLYAWKGSDYPQAYPQQRHRFLALSLTTILAIACFSLAGWYILQYTVFAVPSPHDLFPLMLLIVPYIFFQQLERTTRTSRAK
jgi:hypothetical protein